MAQAHSVYAACVLRQVLAIVLPPVGLVGIYALAPLDPARSGVAGFVLAAGLGLFCVVLAFELRRVARSDTPVMVALASIAFFIPLLLVVFAYAFAVMSVDSPEHFSEPLTRIDALYFAVTTFATVGFGDITAESQLARATVTGQIVLNLIVLGGILRLFTSVAQRRLQARGPGEGPLRSKLAPAAPPTDGD